MTAAPAPPAFDPLAASSPPLSVRQPVLHRQRDQLQIGSEPEQAVVVEHLAPPLTARRVGVFLRALQRPRTPSEVVALITELRLPPDDVRYLLLQLHRWGLLVLHRPHDPLRVRVVGSGAMRRVLERALTGPTVQVAVDHTRTRRPTFADDQLVVLTDAGIPDPWILDRLMSERIAHMPVTLRGAAGVVGPLVLPAMSACVRCVDQHRAHADPLWPRLSAQLMGISEIAPASVVSATAGVALGQIDQILAGRFTCGSAPDAVNTMIEIRTAPMSLRSHPVPRHPLCSCYSPERSSGVRRGNTMRGGDDGGVTHGGARSRET